MHPPLSLLWYLNALRETRLAPLLRTGDLANFFDSRVTELHSPKDLKRYPHRTTQGDTRDKIPPASLL